MSSEKVLDISWETILKITFLITSLYIVFQIKHILIWFVFAVIISILFSPAVDLLMKYKVPKIISVSFLYFLVFGIMALVMYFMLTILAHEINQLSQVIPQYLESLSPTLRGMGVYIFDDINSFIQNIKGSLMELTKVVSGAFFAFFGGILTTFFIMTVAFFLSLEDRFMEKVIILIFPKKYEEFAYSLWNRSQKKVGSWFLTRIFSCTFVGLAVYVSALLLGVRYPLSIGLIAGLFNFIPYLGALISGSFIFAITVMDDINRAIFMIGAFMIVQLIENSVINPILAKKIIEMSPVLVILAISIGGTLWGILGALLAIPLVGILSEFIKEFLEKREVTSAE